MTAATSAGAAAAGAGRRGIHLGRFFTAGIEGSVYDRVVWATRSATIHNEKGVTLFEQEVEVPASWSQTAADIVASKYFHDRLGTPERENSVQQLVHRVVDTVANWGSQQGYFQGADDVEAFRDELAHLVLTQKASLNSPVWFNVGVAERRGYGWYYDRTSDAVRKVNKDETRPQCSACFINSVDDSMESILELAKTEGMLFKYGSGTGSNLSRIREENASLSSGGRASGPLSFMRGFDAFAGVIKSGGKTRRAAKMVILDVDHPDIESFIWCKAREERKAHALIDAGFDASLDGDAYASIFFQNANNSVRATDAFMRAVEEDRDFDLVSRVDGCPVKQCRAAICCARSPKQPIGAAILVCSLTARSTAGTLARPQEGSMPRTRVRSTCSWTTRPATSRR